MFLIFLLSSLNLTIELRVKAIYIVYILLCILLIIPLFLKSKKIRVNIPILVIMFLFMLFCGMSSLINSDIRLLIISLVIFILYLVSCLVLPMLSFDVNSIIFSTFLTSHVLLILISLITSNGINEVPYKGIFYNTNSFGTIAATIFVILLSRFLIYIETLIRGDKSSKNKSLNFFINCILLILFFYLIIISGSRTSFLASVICLVIGFMYLLIYLFKFRKIEKLIIRGGILLFVSSIFLMLIIKFTTIDEAILNNIIFKFKLRASESGGLLSARDRIWAKALEDATIFGNGKDYFTELGIGAHNTFISILGQYGWLVLLCFIIFLIMVFYYVTKYSLSNSEDKYKYLPLLIFIAFLAMSMGEDMIFKASMIIMFFSFGEVLKKTKSG